jgi:hypothetical protein
VVRCSAQAFGAVRIVWRTPGGVARSQFVVAPLVRDTDGPSSPSCGSAQARGQEPVADKRGRAGPHRGCGWPLFTDALSERQPCRRPRDAGRTLAAARRWPRRSRVEEASRHAVELLTARLHGACGRAEYPRLIDDLRCGGTERSRADDVVPFLWSGHLDWGRSSGARCSSRDWNRDLGSRARSAGSASTSCAHATCYEPRAAARRDDPAPSSRSSLARADGPAHGVSRALERHGAAALRCRFEVQTRHALLLILFTSLLLVFIYSLFLHPPSILSSYLYSFTS